MTLFATFAETCEEIKATSKKLEKIATLSNYLRTLDERSLPIACRFLSGYVFPRWTGEEVLVSWSTISDALMSICEVNELRYLSLYKKHGDLGSTAEELLLEMRTQVPLTKKALTIPDVQKIFKKMASLSGKGSSEARRRILKGLLLNCSPLEAKYLIKILTSELRIGLTKGLVQESIAKAFTTPIDEVRRATLVTGDVGEVAVMAKRGFGEVLGIVPMRPVDFMLAESMPSADVVVKQFPLQLYAEYKYDGVRVQSHKKGDRVRLYSRKLENVSSDFPEVVKAMKSCPHDFVIDGEVIPFEEGKPLPFQALQRRLHRKRITEGLMKACPILYMVYDILYLNDKTLIDEPLSERRKLLERLGFSGIIKLSPIHVVKGVDEIRSLFEKSKEMGYEGLMLKVPDSPYTLGKRGKLWMKLKRELDTLDVVVVAAEYGHGKRAGLISDYTFAVKDGKRLRVVGKAYSGLTDEEIAWMTAKLRELAVEEWVGGLTVRPEIVLEVAFDGVQKSDRHERGGFALRFPRIKRIRHDKGVNEIDTIERVKELYLKQRAWTWRERLSRDKRICC